MTLSKKTKYIQRGPIVTSKQTRLCDKINREWKEIAFSKTVRKRSLEEARIEPELDEKKQSVL